MNRIPRAVLALALVVATTAVPAATRYITDELRVSVRAGAGERYRIIEVIGSGTEVETLETDGEWTRVETPAGNTGWLRGQYLEERPIAADRLEAVQAELEAARERIAGLEQDLAEARSQAEAARARNEALGDEVAALEQRVAEAREGLELRQENARLQEQVAALQDRVEELRARARELADRRSREWFMIGGGVVLGGILFGMLVTRIPWRSRRDRLF